MNRYIATQENKRIRLYGENQKKAFIKQGWTVSPDGSKLDKIKESIQDTVTEESEDTEREV